MNRFDMIFESLFVSSRIVAHGAFEVPFLLMDSSIVYCKVTFNCMPFDNCTKDTSLCHNPFHALYSSEFSRLYDNVLEKGIQDKVSSSLVSFHEYFACAFSKLRK